MQPGQRRLTGFVQPQLPEPVTDAEPEAAELAPAQPQQQQQPTSLAPASAPLSATGNVEWQPLPAMHPKYTAGQTGVWRWTSITRRSERQAATTGAVLCCLSIY